MVPPLMTGFMALIMRHDNPGKEKSIVDVQGTVYVANSCMKQCMEVRESRIQCYIPLVVCIAYTNKPMLSSKGLATRNDIVDDFVMDLWTKALYNGFSIYSRYLDFMKAFGTVPHKRLTYTLRMNGISPLHFEMDRRQIEESVVT